MREETLLLQTSKTAHRVREAAKLEKPGRPGLKSTSRPESGASAMFDEERRRNRAHRRESG
jgi:hypothetical protein